MKLLKGLTIFGYIDDSSAVIARANLLARGNLMRLLPTTEPLVGRRHGIYPAYIWCGIPRNDISV
jgi:hypothetical protein